MLFTEFRFLIFFAIVFAVYWTVRPNSARKAWLLACSYAFYAAWDWRFLSLIFASTAVDFVVARRMERLPVGPARRPYLIASLAQPNFVNVFMGRNGAFVKDNGFGDGTNVGEKATLASQRELRALCQSKNLDVRQIGASTRSYRE